MEIEEFNKKAIDQVRDTISKTEFLLGHVDPFYLTGEDLKLYYVVNKVIKIMSNEDIGL